MATPATALPQTLIPCCPVHDPVSHPAFRCGRGRSSTNAPAAMAPGNFALEHDLDDPGAQVRTAFVPNPARGAFFIVGRSRLRHVPFVQLRARARGHRPIPDVGLEGRRWSDCESDSLGREDWPAAWKARCAVQRPPRWLRGVEGGSEDECEGDDEGDGGPVAVKREGRRRCVVRSRCSSGEESSSDASRTFESWSCGGWSLRPEFLGLDRVGMGEAGSPVVGVETRVRCWMEGVRAGDAEEDGDEDGPDWSSETEAGSAASQEVQEDERGEESSEGYEGLGKRKRRDSDDGEDDRRGDDGNDTSGGEESDSSSSSSSSGPPAPTTAPTQPPPAPPPTPPPRPRRRTLLELETSFRAREAADERRTLWNIQSLRAH